MADPLHPPSGTSPTRPGCLEPEVVQDLLAGRLPPGPLQDAERHLEGCEACQLLRSALARETLDTSGDDGDTFPASSRPRADRPAPLLRDPRVALAPVTQEPDEGHGDTAPARSGPQSGRSSPALDDSPAARSAEPGTQVGRYRVERRLGAGGMGQVLLAYDPELDRRVALKLMQAGGLAEHGLELRLLREAQAMARVSHPNVVTVHDVGLWEGQVFLAMEYVEGGTLSEWLKEKRSVRQVLEVFRQAGAGLAAAHRAGLVHRDFKPDNVLIARDGAVRVTDFGLARTVTAPERLPAAPGSQAPVLLDQSITLAGSVMGTPQYMSPEQHEGLPTDARTDQFAFCVALYQALYGQRPFPGDSLLALRQAITTGQLRQPPREARVPDWLRELVLRGLRVAPAERFPSMDALLEALARDPEVEDGLSRARGPRARLRALLLGGLATALVAAVATTQPWWKGFEERAQGLMLAARPRPWNDRIALVAIDQSTIRRVGWPVPRQLQARVLEALARAGVQAVAYDGFFSLPGRDGPQADARFGEALARFKRAVLAVPCTADPDLRPAQLGEQVAPSSLSPGDAPAFFCDGVLTPIEPLRRAAPVAQVEIARSASGTARGAYLLANVAGQKLPTLALATFAVGEGVPLSSIAQTPDALRVGGLRVPLDRTGATLASFRKPTRAFSFGDLAAALSPADPPTLPEAFVERLRGRYVLVGQTAESIQDLGSFATGEHLPLVFLHGALLADLLEGRPLREAPPAAQLAAILLFGALLTAAGQRLRPALTGAALLAVLLGIFGGGLWLARAGIAVSPLGPAVASVLAFAVALAERLAAGDRDRRLVKGAFHTYLNESALRRILQDPKTTLPLEGARRHVTVLCASARSPTGEATQLSPEEEISRRRGRLKAMTEQVLAEDGRVEALQGEGLVAVFGDPVRHADHPRRAVAAGLALQRALTAAEPGVEVRVGVATGLALVGNIGPEQGKIEYSVLGAPVERAAQLARQAPAGGVLVSAEARQGCPDHFEFEGLPDADPSGAPALARPKPRAPR